MIDLFSAFLVGIFGSLHCVGMCGPLVLALPLTRTEKSAVVYQSLIYNLGRIFLYALLGLLIGTIGWGLQLGGLQKMFSIGLGITLILTSLNAFNSFFNVNKLTSLVSIKSAAFLKKAFSVSSNFSAFRIGMLNGLLPCGLVYTALATSITMSSPLQSSFYMAIFGLGTLPLMYAVMVGGKLYKGVALKLKRFLPVFTILLGVYLIFRGINLHVAEDPSDIVNGLVKMSCH